MERKNSQLFRFARFDSQLDGVPEDQARHKAWKLHRALHKIKGTTLQKQLSNRKVLTLSDQQQLLGDPNREWYRLFHTRGEGLHPGARHTST